MHLVSFQIRIYKLDHHSPLPKLLSNQHGEILTQTHQLPPEISHKNLVKKYYFENE